MPAQRRTFNLKTTRRLVQLSFLLLVLAGVYVVGAHCERWCPFGGVEASYIYITEGDMLCSLGTANFFILGGVLLMTLLLRRAFCGYMCPIGTISEWLRLLGRWLRIPAVPVPYALDRVLASLKYVVLVVILWLTWQAGELIFRGFDPCYALISRHGTDITVWAYVVSGAIAVASLAIMLPFCRWLCPLAAVLNPFSWFGVTRVKRDKVTCTNCGLCSKDCPVDIPVHQLEQVTAARCLSCMNCIESCPHKKSRAITWGPPRVLGGSWSQAALIFLMLLCTSGAVIASYKFPIPSFVKVRGEAPEQVAVVQLKVTNLTCRGRANLLYYFLDRDDELYKFPGYFKLEAWPGPGVADIRVTYDPSQTNEEAIKQAITESYYDTLADYWRHSPFRIEGYDPPGLDLGGELDGLPPLP
jgi:hypothetical protein